MVSGLANGTLYEWQVRATAGGGTTEANSGAWYQFTTLVEIPGPYSKTAPADNATNQALSLTLSWESSERAEEYRYCVDTVENTVCDTSWISTGIDTTVNVSGLSPSTGYFWQIRAINAAGSIQANTNTWWSFMTEVSQEVFADGFEQPDP
jgi:hypothetical protein